MKDWKRIVLVIFVLIGGTASFGFWSLNQFDNEFDNLSAVYTANILPIYLSSTTPETSSIISTEEDNVDPKFKLIFLAKDSVVYTGCTYEITWTASTTIKYIEASVVDAGTRQSTGPIASGLPKENIIEPDLQILKWKVGLVWPGEYFISVLNVNSTTTNERSEKIIIDEMSDDLSIEQQKELCKESGGLL